MLNQKRKTSENSSINNKTNNSISSTSFCSHHGSCHCHHDRLPPHQRHPNSLTPNPRLWRPSRRPPSPSPCWTGQTWCWTAAAARNPWRKLWRTYMASTRSCTTPPKVSSSIRAPASSLSDSLFSVASFTLPSERSERRLRSSAYFSHFLAPLRFLLQRYFN